MRNLIRSITPGFLLVYYRKRTKAKVRESLRRAKESGEVITEVQLMQQLTAMGIVQGDTVLVHTSMSKMGYLEDGPITFINAIRNQVGLTGNILMPSSPNASLQKEYVQKNPVFDVVNTPSRLGAISETYRKQEGVKRSLHATEPVCAFGPDADFLTNGHFKALTPYDANSPFQRLYEKKGKILYVGVTLDNAGTNLHTLEDTVDFPYQVYDEKVFNIHIIDNKGVTHKCTTKVHNPEWSSKRKCDQLLPMFKAKGVYQEGKLGKANTLIFDGEKMFQTMKEQYEKQGVTMYHPNGNI